MSHCRIALRKAVREAVRVGAGLAAVAAASRGAIAAQPFPAVFELSSLDGTNGYVLTGAGSNHASGGAVHGAGDVNGDGFRDVIIGASGADPHGLDDAGESYVVFGSASPIHSPVALGILDGTNGFAIVGAKAGDLSGIGVAGAFDFDADGFGDLIVGATDADPNHQHRAGQAYIIFGGPTVGQSGTLRVSELNGITGLTMNGTHKVAQLGQAVGGVPDINGDGFDEIIIGADWADPAGRHDAGQSYVVLGSARTLQPPIRILTTLDGTDGFMLDGIDVDDYSGRAAAGAGDLNGDGLGDVIIGAQFADADGRRDSGEAYVVFGSSLSPPAHVELSSLDGTNGFLIEGIDPYDNCGLSVGGVGDVNDDGYTDLIVGAPRAQPGGDVDRGEAYVIFGRPDLGSGGRIRLSELNGSNGFTLLGVAEGDWAGWSVGAAGDVNADGIDDLIVGAHRAGPGGRSRAGQVYVVYGRPALGIEGVIEIAALDGETGFTIDGIDPSDYAGIAVAGPGDVNGDGIDDLLIGAFGADPNGISRAGESYVIFGRAVDTDDDGFADREDNCTQVANADQRDTNGDGYGNACDPDLDDNAIVNFTDLALLKAGFFGSDPDADLDGDGLVNFADLGRMKSFFFLPPGPSGIVQ